MGTEGFHNVMELLVEFTAIANFRIRLHLMEHTVIHTTQRRGGSLECVCYNCSFVQVLDHPSLSLCLESCLRRIKSLEVRGRAGSSRVGIGGSYGSDCGTGRAVSCGASSHAGKWTSSTHTAAGQGQKGECLGSIGSDPKRRGAEGSLSADEALKAEERGA